MQQSKALPIFQSLAIFGASRLIVLMALAFAAARMIPNPVPGTWNVTDQWWGPLERYDTGYYLYIAQHGYADGAKPSTAIAFHPGYPILIWALTRVSGMRPPLAALVIANACTLGAMILLFILVRRQWGDDVALGTIALLSFFPASIFLSAAYSEGPALLVTAAFFVLLLRGRLALAAACAAAMSAIRPPGILLAIPLVYEIWVRYGRRFSIRFVASALAAMLVAAAGLIAFAAYCWARFNDPIAFLHGREHWGIPGVTGKAAAWRDLTGGFHALIWPNTSDAWMFVVFTAIAIVCWKRLPVSLALYTACNCLLLMVAQISAVGFLSINRCLLLLFPCLICAATLLVRRVWLMVSVVAIMAGLLFMYSALFAQWYWVG